MLSTSKYNQKRKVTDAIKLTTTFLATSFCVIILFGIIIYILATGLPNFNLRLLTSDNKETLNTITLQATEEVFTDPNIDDAYFSSRYGISIRDTKTTDGNKAVEVVYIHQNSPFLKAKTINGETYRLEKNTRLDTLILKDSKTGMISFLYAKDGALQIASKLDNYDTIFQAQCKTGGGGARGSLIATLELILITLIIALPIGVLAAVYLKEYAKDGKLKHILISMIDMTSGLPSIIFGFCGALIFIPFCDGTFKTSGYSILAGSLTMVIVLLPTIIKTTTEALAVIPRHYTMASLSLGASKTQTVFKVILPNAIPGILTATLLCIGRIIGESAALIFVMGTSIADDISLTNSATSLSLHIWSLMQGENPNYSTASAIAIFILIVVLVLSIFIKLISKKLNKMAVAQ